VCHALLLGQAALVEVPNVSVHRRVEPLACSGMMLCEDVGHTPLELSNKRWAPLRCTR
jgi:hypothetical protein